MSERMLLIAITTISSINAAFALCNFGCNWQKSGGIISATGQDENFSISCGNSVFIAKFPSGFTEKRECWQRRGPFYIVRRNGNEYRCAKEVAVNKDSIFHYKTPFRKFKSTPNSICEVCHGFMPKPFPYVVRGVPAWVALAVKPPPIGCNRPLGCATNYYDKECSGCEPYADDGMCCKGCKNY